MCVSRRYAAFLRQRSAVRSRYLSDRKNRQSESSEEYSTEDCGRGRGLCPETNQVAREALQQGENDEVGQQQEEQDGAGMKIPDAGKQWDVNQSAQREDLRQTAPVRRRGWAAEQDLFGELPGEYEKQQQGKAQPAVRSQPGFVEGEFEPAGVKEHQDQGRSAGDGEQISGNPRAGRQRFAVAGEDQETAEKEKDGEIVSVHQAHEVNRNEAQGQHQGCRDPGQARDEQAPEEPRRVLRRPKRVLYRAIRFARIGFAKKGRDQDREPGDAQDRSEGGHVAGKWRAGTGAEKLRSPGTNRQKGSVRKQDADVTGARNDLVPA